MRLNRRERQKRGVLICMLQAGDKNVKITSFLPKPPVAAVSIYAALTRSSHFSREKRKHREFGCGRPSTVSVGQLRAKSWPIVLSTELSASIRLIKDTLFIVLTQ